MSSIAAACGAGDRRQVGVNIPLQACEHFYIVTEPMEA
jgi:hypothetical protein